MLGRCQVGSAEFQQGEPGSNVATRRKPSDNLAVACPRTVRMNTPKVARAHFRPCTNAGATTRQNQGQKESRYGRPCLAPGGLGAGAWRESSRSHRFVARKRRQKPKNTSYTHQGVSMGEGRSKLGPRTLRAETAPIKQTQRPFLGTLTSGDTTAGIERPRGALRVAGGSG